MGWSHKQEKSPCGTGATRRVPRSGGPSEEVEFKPRLRSLEGHSQFGYRSRTHFDAEPARMFPSTLHRLSVDCLSLSFEASESQKGFEFGIVDFCPSLDFGEGGDVADESEKDDGKHGRKGMRLSLSGAGIADFF